jgi:hypothetical protein
MRRPLGLALLALCLQCIACAPSGGSDLARWTLSVPGEAPSSVELPTILAVPDRAAHYVLAADVAVPATMRGRSVSIAVADSMALATLRVDGEPTMSCLTVPFERYRSNGASCWHFVAPDAPSMHLEITVENTTPLAHVFSTAPVFVDAPDGGARFRSIVIFDYASELATVCIAGLLATLYLIAYLFDRSRRAHLWFSLQAFAAAAYPLWWLGATQALIGAVDRAVMAMAMCFACYMSVLFTYAELGLGGRVHRGWAVMLGGGGLLGLAQVVPFQPQWLPIATSLAIDFGTLGQVILCARALPRSRDRTTPLVIGGTWLLILLAAPFDVPALIGLPTIGGGVRLVSLAIAMVGFGQGALLARQHVRSLRDADRLNADLRRQIAERSRDLADALAQLGSGSAGQQLREGEVVSGRYRVVRLLGAGGMGHVYEVVRIADEHRLALKLLGSAATRDDFARLAREAEIAAKIAHPNLVAIADVDVTETHGLFLVMELVAGGSVADRRDRWGDAAWAMPVLRQVGVGLAALHDAGIVHRDLKPANVLLASDHAVAKISDFGISAVDTRAALAAADTLVQGDDGTARSPALTRTGMMLGTPQYMAPELAHGSRRATAAADVFAFAVLAHELLFAEYPFGAPPILDAIYGRAPARKRSFATAAALGADAARVLDACLEWQPARRPSARDVVDALDAS